MKAPDATDRPRRGAGRRWIVSLVLAVVLLAAAERGIRRLWARHLLPTGEAVWIWAPDLGLEDGPVSFYLGRDLDLGFHPRQARLLILADEEYVVFLNGQLAASNRYRPGSPLDAYEVGRFLRRGSNRILVELRSSRGVGGLLLHLSAAGPGEGATLVSDGGWRVIRTHERALFDLDEALPEGPPPRIWGPPPAGRWSSSLGEGIRPTFRQLRSRARPLDAVRVLPGPENGDWLEAGPVRRDSPALGSWVTFDFGEELTGFLSFRFPVGVSPTGLIYVGPGPPSPRRQRADAFLIPMPGRRAWSDSAPRRFRFVTFVGIDPVSGAQVFPTDPERSEPWLATGGWVKGVFGLESSRLRTPLEDKVWSELERRSRVALGEEG